MEEGKTTHEKILNQDEIVSKLQGLRALADAIVCIGIAGSNASLMPDTLQNLGQLQVDLASEVLDSLDRRGTLVNPPTT